jgi:hypothetical protein
MSAELFKPHISMSDAHSIAPQWFLVVRRVHLAGTVVCAFGRGEVEMVCGLFVTVFRVFKQAAACLSTDHCQSHALFYFILKEIQTICLQNTVTIIEISAHRDYSRDFSKSLVFKHSIAGACTIYVNHISHPECL